MEENKNKLFSIEGDKPRIDAKKKLAELSNGDFTYLQTLLQEIQANDSVGVMSNQPRIPLTKQIETLKQKIETDFAEEIELKSLLLETIPSYSTVRRWMELPGWEAAIFDKIKNKELFENVNKATVIKTIYTRAINGDMRAAELYWKIGENFYSKESKKDSKDDVYEDLNKILHNKK